MASLEEEHQLLFPKNTTDSSRNWWGIGLLLVGKKRSKADMLHMMCSMVDRSHRWQGEGSAAEQTAQRKLEDAGFVDLGNPSSEHDIMCPGENMLGAFVDMRECNMKLKSTSTMLSIFRNQSDPKVQLIERLFRWAFIAPLACFGDRVAATNSSSHRRLLVAISHNQLIESCRDTPLRHLGMLAADRVSVVRYGVGPLVKRLLCPSQLTDGSSSYRYGQQCCIEGYRACEVHVDVTLVDRACDFVLAEEAHHGVDEKSLLMLDTFRDRSGQAHVKFHIELHTGFVAVMPTTPAMSPVEQHAEEPKQQVSSSAGTSSAGTSSAGSDDGPAGESDDPASPASSNSHLSHTAVLVSENDGNGEDEEDEFHFTPLPDDGPTASLPMNRFIGAALGYVFSSSQGSQIQ